MIKRLFRKPVTEHFLSTKITEAARPSEPSDILWENFSFSNEFRSKLRNIVGVLVLLAIVLGLGLIIVMNILQKKAAENAEGISNSFFSYIISLSVTGINIGLIKLIKALTRNEIHTTYTSYYEAMASKLTLAQFINTCVASFIAKWIIAGDFEKMNIYKPNGLIEDVFSISLADAFLVPLIRFADFPSLIKKYKRLKMEKLGEKCRMTQAQAHKLYENREMDLPKNYAGIIKGMLFACFYAPAYPLIPILYCVGLILKYWVDKYSFLRRVSAPYVMGPKLAVEMVEVLEWCLLSFTIGNIVFSNSVKNKYGDLGYWDDGLLWSAFVLSLLNIVAPMEFINTKIFKIEDEVTEKLPFKLARVMCFTTDYDLQNPVTRESAMREYEEMRTKFAENDEIMSLLFKGEKFTPTKTPIKGKGILRKKNFDFKVEKYFLQMYYDDEMYEKFKENLYKFNILTPEIHGDTLENYAKQYLKAFNPFKNKRINDPRIFQSYLHRVAKRKRTALVMSLGLIDIIRKRAQSESQPSSMIIFGNNVCNAEVFVSKFRQQAIEADYNEDYSENEGTSPRRDIQRVIIRNDMHLDDLNHEYIQENTGSGRHLISSYNSTFTMITSIGSER